MLFSFWNAPQAHLSSQASRFQLRGSWSNCVAPFLLPSGTLLASCHQHHVLSVFVFVFISFLAHELSEGRDSARHSVDIQDLHWVHASISGGPITTYTIAWCRFSRLFLWCSTSCLCAEQVTTVSARVPACCRRLALPLHYSHFLGETGITIPTLPRMRGVLWVKWGSVCEHTVKTPWHQAILLALFQSEWLAWTGGFVKKGTHWCPWALALARAGCGLLVGSSAPTMPGRPVAWQMAVTWTLPAPVRTCVVISTFHWNEGLIK